MRPEEGAGEMSVTSEAIEKGTQMILSGELHPGSKLPRGNELATHRAEGESWLRRALGRDIDGEAPEGG
jgi:DNA-binding FadR family transcriptional regulator